MLEILNKYRFKIGIFAVTVTVLNFVVWWNLFVEAPQGLVINFLNVGQGDSSLIILPGGVKLLIDGGRPDRRILEELSQVLPANDRYLDLVLATHNDADHLGGLVEVLKRYEVGAFLYNGRPDENLTQYQEAMSIAAEKKIKVVVLGRGDLIKNGESLGEIFWPTVAALSGKSTNDSSVVLRLTAEGTRALFAGDISSKVENILGNFGRIDILKIPHHGSKYSSSAGFLNRLKPRLAIVEVGKNSYGHPTAEVLNRLAQIGASVYRTDLDGRVRVEFINGKLRIFKQN